jgi:transcriptional regulator with XRE-family HTH domain
VSADPIVPVFAARLRRARLARHWTLRDLAERSGISSAGLSKIENSQADPGLSTVARIARAFGMTVGQMVAESLCERCDDTPPAGFTCNECGRKGGDR